MNASLAAARTIATERTESVDDEMRRLTATALDPFTQMRAVLQQSSKADLMFMMRDRDIGGVSSVSNPQS